MKTLARNKRTIYYALPTASTPQYDEYGNETGSPAITYSAPVAMKVNISADRNSNTGMSYTNSQFEPFGIAERYEHCFVTEDMDCPIDEESIIWYGITPDVDGESGAVKHNFKVVGKFVSINNIRYTIKEVAVS